MTMMKAVVVSLFERAEASRVRGLSSGWVGIPNLTERRIWGSKVDSIRPPHDPPAPHNTHPRTTSSVYRRSAKLVVPFENWLVQTTKRHSG